MPPIDRRAYLKYTGLASIGGLPQASRSGRAESATSNQHKGDSGPPGQSSAPVDLRTEYETDPNNLPIGAAPRFTWTVPSEDRGFRQTAFQVLVATSHSSLRREQQTSATPGQEDPPEQKLVWDSGKVGSARSINVSYGGDSLDPDTTYHWSVRIWHSHDEPGAWSDTATFTTAITAARPRLQEASHSGTSDPVSSGQAAPAPAASAPPGADWTDYTFEADFTIKNAAAGFVFRARDAENFYMWLLDQRPALGAGDDGDSSQLYLREHSWVDGNFVVLKTVPVGLAEPSVQHHMTIDVQGQQITTSIDGEQVDTTVDATHSRGTIGFREFTSEHALFDNVRVTDPAGKVLFSDEFAHSSVKHFTAGQITNEQLDLAGTGVVLRGAPGDGEEPGDGGDGSEPGPGNQWDGSWIGHPEPSEAAPMFRREVTLEKNVERARLHISGLGHYEAHINGERVGDAVLDPGRTDYEGTVLYATHDVTDHVSNGSNAIGVTLGRARYGTLTESVWNWDDAPWWSDPELLAQLNIEFADGTTTSVSTDTNWRVADGPLQSDALFEGEVYDARQEHPGWPTPGFDDTDWAHATAVEGPTGRLTPQRTPPVKVTESLTPVAVSEPRDGVYVFELDQIIAGWTELTVDGPEGTEVTLTMGEKLNGDGTVNNRNALVTPPMQVDRYTLSGVGQETWESRFSYKGFRYVQVEGYPGTPTTDDITAKVVHTAVDEGQTSEFTCSNDLFDRIHENTRWTVLANLHSVPEDTPTYEMNGWTADAHLSAETAIYNFDMARFHTKWLQDIRDGQDNVPEGTEAGNIPVINPSPDWGYTGWTPDPNWQSAFVLVPWYLHQYYGDERILAKHYEGLKKYLEYLGRHADGQVIRSGLGDWGAPAIGSGPAGPSTALPTDTGQPEAGPDLLSTAYYYRDAEILAQIAELLGLDKEASKFEKLSEEIKSAFNDEFLYPDDVYRTTASGGSTPAPNPQYRQTSNVYPLAFGLVPETRVDGVVENLVYDVMVTHDGHLNTGIHGTKRLLQVLTEHGHHDVAYRVATRRDYPSWGHWIDNDMTGILEFWPLNARSRQHYALGAIDEWFYQYVLGVREPVEPGFAHVEIVPGPVTELDWLDVADDPTQGSIEPLTSAEGTVDTVRGDVKVLWELTTGGIDLDVTIPGNTTATVRMPTRNTEMVVVTESGTLIWNAGKPVEPLPAGITEVRREDDMIVVEVGAGSYTFALEPA